MTSVVVWVSVLRHDDVSCPLYCVMLYMIVFSNNFECSTGRTNPSVLAAEIDNVGVRRFILASGFVRIS